MSAANNPLRQYFRRPGLYFALPSGGALYDEGVVDMPPNGELAVFPMTSNDELTLRVPDALFNGAAMVDLIRSCVPSILDPWRINNIDFDAIIIAIRAASVGNTMDIDSVCPSCENQGTYEIDLVRLLSQQRDIDYGSTLKVRELEIQFRPLRYVEMNKNNLNQFQIQRTLLEIGDYENTPEKQQQMSEAMDKMNDLVTDIIVSTIEFIKTPDTVVSDKNFISDFMKNCDKRTYDAIRDESIKLREANEIKPSKIKCSACEHSYDQRVILNATDFFV
jgi:hypothetical protein